LEKAAVWELFKDSARILHLAFFPDNPYYQERFYGLSSGVWTFNEGFREFRGLDQSRSDRFEAHSTGNLGVAASILRLLLRSLSA
jgi:hypothetical protein